MNQMELKTHECLQFFLPRIAVALEDISKELKKQNVLDAATKSQTDLNDIPECESPRTQYLMQSTAFEMLYNAGIPVRYDCDGDIVLLNGDLLIGDGFCFLKPRLTASCDIKTTIDDRMRRRELTKAHITKFITDYKHLEEEASK